MADKKEVNILLLGIVAILAIVGLVLLFTSPAATGKAWQPPALGPQVETPAPIGYGDYIAGGQYGQATGQMGNAIIIPTLEGVNLPRCPNGALRTREQGNINYEAIPGHMCSWFYCPGLDNVVAPQMACAQV